MRASHNDIAIVESESGQFLGLNLGYDFTAEHEWGIKDLQEAFGINPTANPGIARRAISKNPGVVLIEFQKKKKDFLVLYHVESYNSAHGLEIAKDSLYLDALIPSKWNKNPKPFVAAWDQKSFAVAMAKTPENKQHLEDMQNALSNGNALIFLGGGGLSAFSRSGLHILIKSALPKDYVDACKNVDLEAAALDKADKKTGIRKKLANADKGYFALSPRICKTPWDVVCNAEIAEVPPKEGYSQGERTLRSKYPVVYFLNAHNQKAYHSGWFTVEELEQWTKGEGPVIKKAK